MRRGRRRFVWVNTIAALALGSLPLSFLTLGPSPAGEAWSVLWWVLLLGGLGGTTALLSRAVYPQVAGADRAWKQVPPFLGVAALTAVVMSLLTAGYFSAVTFGFETHEKEAVIWAVPVLWLLGGGFAAVVLLVLDLVLLRDYLGLRIGPPREGGAPPAA